MLLKEGRYKVFGVKQLYCPERRQMLSISKNVNNVWSFKGLMVLNEGQF